MKLKTKQVEVDAVKHGSLYMIEGCERTYFNQNDIDLLFEPANEKPVDEESPTPLIYGRISEERLTELWEASYGSFEGLEIRDLITDIRVQRKGLKGIATWCVEAAEEVDKLKKVLGDAASRLDRIAAALRS